MGYNHLEVWEAWFDKYDGDVTKRSPNDIVLRGKDICGAELDKGAYGDTGSDYGWQVDHIIPEARFKSGEFGGDPDHPDNLRPLHWANNEAKGDRLDEEGWDCAATV